MIPTVYGVEAMSFVSVEPLLKKSKHEMQALVNNACIDPSIEVDIQILIGRPASVITEYANDNGAKPDYPRFTWTDGVQAISPGKCSRIAESEGFLCRINGKTVWKIIVERSAGRS